MPECQEAFEALQSNLTAAPVLAVPNDVDQYTLDTDASDEAIGAVLGQIRNEVERPVAYASRKLFATEKYYCATRKQLPAIVQFLKYFRYYLLGRAFIVRTSHAPSVA